uniref:Peptidoglycan-recognition protein LB n=1 Tax=Culex pipiens TaxID=7175 RepID=A0A8D8MQW1_CULPI
MVITGRRTSVLAVVVLQVLGTWNAMACSMPMVPYVSRDVWSANAPRSVDKFLGPIPFVIIHHTYEPAACYTPADCCKAMQAIQRFHQQDRGWNDIGYSFVVGGDGRIYQGRGFNVVGAHAPRYNDKSVGICLIGDWRGEFEALGEICGNN